MENEEQKKIGAFFSNLDNSITLHQRQYNHAKEPRFTWPFLYEIRYCG